MTELLLRKRILELETELAHKRERLNKANALLFVVNKEILKYKDGSIPDETMDWQDWHREYVHYKDRISN